MASDWTCTYQLIDCACAEGIYEVSDQLKEEDDEEGRRHGPL